MDKLYFFKIDENFDNYICPRLLSLISIEKKQKISKFRFDVDKKLLEKTGIKFTVLSGCCGLAGNFGMEKGHYETSVAVAENALLPALRKAPAGTYLLADGFSCRTQADQLGNFKSITLAQLLTKTI